MKIAIYGGSFDPLHKAHQELLVSAQKHFNFARIYLVPTGYPPHKQRNLSMASLREQMCKLASKDLPYVRLWRSELARPALLSYTYKTVARIKQQLLAEEGHDLEIYLLIGSDVLFSIEEWYEFPLLARSIKLGVALRGQAEQAECQKQAEYLRAKYKLELSFFAMPALNLSSSNLRTDLQHNTAQAKDFPPEVWTFLQQNKIYQFDADWQRLERPDLLKLLSLEQRLRLYLPPERVFHSICVLQYALHLAHKHQLAAVPVCQAALLHDVAKYFPLKEQYSLAAKAGAKSPLNHKIAHAPAAAYFLRRFFAIRDRAVLTAVQHHSSYTPTMPTTAKLIFLADKIELSRNFTDLAELRKQAEEDLELAASNCAAAVLQARRRKWAVSDSAT